MVLEQRNALLQHTHIIKSINVCCTTHSGWSPTTTLVPTTTWVSCLATHPMSSLASGIPKSRTKVMSLKIVRFWDGLGKRSTARKQICAKPPRQVASGLGRERASSLTRESVLITTDTSAHHHHHQHHHHTHSTYASPSWYPSASSLS